MVQFNERLSDAVTAKRLFGRSGAPWEFNLRDILRWSQLAASVAGWPAHPAGGGPAVGPEQAAAVAAATFPAVYAHRLRSREDRLAAWGLFAEAFPGAAPRPVPAVEVSAETCAQPLPSCSLLDAPFRKRMLKRRLPPPPLQGEGWDRRAPARRRLRASLLRRRRAPLPLAAARAGGCGRGPLPGAGWRPLRSVVRRLLSPSPLSQS